MTEIDDDLCHRLKASDEWRAKDDLLARIREFATRLKQAGKPAKAVIVACMRKSLTIVNAMLKNNEPWRPKNA